MLRWLECGHDLLQTTWLIATEILQASDKVESESQSSEVPDESQTRQCESNRLECEIYMLSAHPLVP